MVNELDMVALSHDVDAFALREGDLGTVVHVYPDGLAYEVEFVRADGETIAVLTLESTGIRPLAKSDILHARPLSMV